MADTPHVGADKSGWTLDTLRAYFEQRLADMNEKNEAQYLAQKEAIAAALAAVERALTAALAAQEKYAAAQLAATQLAVDKAEANTKEWKGTANEWRAAMDDREESFARKEDVGHLEKQIDEVTARIANFASLAALDRRWETAQEKFEAIEKRIVLMMPRTESLARHDTTAKELGFLTTRLDLADGRSKGLDAGWVYLVGGFGLILSILGIVAFFNSYGIQTP